MARACAGLLDESADRVWCGFAFETLLLNELRAYNHYFKKNRLISYYSITGSYDIDFVIETRRKTHSNPGELICIEVKLAKEWNPKWCKPLVDFSENSKAKVRRTIGIYCGRERRTLQGVEIFPVEVFLNELYAGRVF